MSCSFFLIFPLACAQGDSFSIAFHTALDAVTFALELQQALLMAAWPEAILDAWRTVYMVQG
jgi:hypothetical protein